MTSRIQTSGETVEQALRRALADALDCEVEKVELSIHAPGLEELRGDLQLALRIEAPTPEEPSDAPEAVADRSADRGPVGDAAAAAPAPPVSDGGVDVEELEEEADAAADFLEGLLDALDLPGDLRIRVTEDHAELEVVDIGSGALIGRRGQTLEAIQELVRCTLQRQFQRRARVMVDAEGYRARRLEKLLEKAEEAIDAVLETGEPERLEPMDVFERKAVHHLVAEVEGLASRSQGREPARRIMIERE
jgi:spoIIIJ-associated protein